MLLSGSHRARTGLAQLNESEAAAKIRETTKPLVSAVVEGTKVAGEKLAQGAEAAKASLYVRALLPSQAHCLSCSMPACLCGMTN